MKKKPKKVFVGLSGGVDSSVSAYLLKKQGYDVVGVHLRCWNVGGCDVNEAEYARRGAEHLGIPFYLFNLEREYKKAVVDYMIDGYKKGVTPNPDVMCNKEIKFGLFLKKALEMGADFVATGHYVRLRRNLKFKISNFKLEIARDLNKDQSYFLWTLTQEQLKRSLFPLGNLTKPEVRKIAKKIGLPNADKKDSQGICFIGEVPIKDFLGKYIKERQGKIIDETGNVLGRHDGAVFYTIGQRHGLKIGGSDMPYYVKDKDVKKNLLIVAKGEDNPSLFKKEIKLANVNIIDQSTPSLISAKGGQARLPASGGDGRIDEIRVFARVRYRQPLFKARLIYPSTGSGFRLVFDKAQKFIAPGQSAVFYSKKGEMLGGGIII